MDYLYLQHVPPTGNLLGLVQMGALAAKAKTRRYSKTAHTIQLNKAIYHISLHLFVDKQR
jgi:hypothetical protein